MAKIYTGKVVMTIDSADHYAKMLEEAEEQRKPFSDHIFELTEGFEAYIKPKYSAKTVRKHSSIVGLFANFICDYTDVTSMDEITRGMVNTHFRRWWKKKVWDSSTENDLRVALKKFFTFLAMEHNIVNEKALNALK